jgi:hypothetical protein
MGKGPEISAKRFARCIVQPSMRKPLLALCLLALTLPIGCGTDEETPPDPLRNRAGFCNAWAEAACQKIVVKNCNAPSVEDCVASQSDFCLELVPETYSSKHAGECLGAVKSAYKDATLSTADIDVVIRLGAPCDQLWTGTREQGESCDANVDCDTAAGLTCVIKADATSGSCEEPLEVSGGKSCADAEQVCEADFYCNGRNCVAYTETGDVCVGDFECQPSDHCVLVEDATDTTCEARLPLGDDCASDADCQSLYCVKAADAASGICADTLVLSVSEPLCKNLR